MRIRHPNLFLGCVGALAVAHLIVACTTTGEVATKTSEVDAVASVYAACNLLPIAHETFMAIAGRDADKVAIEAKFKVAADNICLDPSKVTNTQGAFQIIAKTISDIIKLSGPQP